MDVEGYDLKETMLRERRDWILQKQAEEGKPPADFEKFYEKIEVDPEAEAAGAEGAADAGKKGKDPKAKKGKGGGDDGEGAEDKLAKIGPNELVRKFETFYGDY